MRKKIFTEHSLDDLEDGVDQELLKKVLRARRALGFPEAPMDEHPWRRRVVSPANYSRLIFGKGKEGSGEVL